MRYFFKNSPAGAAMFVRLGLERSLLISSGEPMRRTLLAVIAGFLVAALLAAAGDVIVQQIAPGALPEAGQPTTGWLFLALGYTALGGAAGGAVAAHLTPGREVRTALVLGITLLAVGLLVVIGRPGTAPLWYHGASLALVIPVALAGGRWRASRRRLMSGNISVGAR